MISNTRVSMVVLGLVFCCMVPGQWTVDAQSSGRSTKAEVVPDFGGDFEGVIQAVRVVSLSAPTDGLLESVAVERGDLVRKGQVVATLESSVETATLELAKTRAKARARLEFLTVKLERETELRTQGIVSKDQIELLETELAVAEEAIAIAALEEKRAAAILALRTLKSPFDGVVIERLLSEGELVTRQHQSKILTLAQVDPLVVEVILPGGMFGSILRGTKADVIPLGFSEEASTAVVKTVDRVIDAASHTFRISLELPNPNHRLPAGLKCSVNFPRGN